MTNFSVARLSPTEHMAANKLVYSTQSVNFLSNCIKTYKTKVRLNEPYFYKISIFIDAYSGILPCLRLGRCSALFSSILYAFINFSLVCSGSITSSI